MMRLLSRKCGLLVILLSALITLLYYSSRKDSSSKGTTPYKDDTNNKQELSGQQGFLRRTDHVYPEPPSLSAPKKSQKPHIFQKSLKHQCPAKPAKAEAVIDTVDIFPTLNFQADWIDSREYWNNKMQRRYEKRRNNTWQKVPLKVFVMPHSHNDPGWLKTYEGYFNSQTKFILDNIIDKLTKYKNMTFIWTEVSYLSLWYSTAHDARKANLFKLIEEGRFEILTGGWIMTDEANVDLFGMVHQLTEGHQWLLSNLNVTTKSSWSCDPFGHGGTFPYILKTSGVNGMVIMRIHYAWKEWFARQQQGDFLWQQHWDSQGKHNILCHNFPYDIYSIKGSCGPHAQKCLEFNYRKVSGDYGEYAARYTPVHPGNVKERSEMLLEQYGKTGSLFPHNVVLVPLGDDFYYQNENEFDQQYTNYKLMMDYINQGNYNAQVQFGTLSDYFDEVNKRMSSFDTLNGDFFVYSDIFSEGRPAYWSGYFTTRPFMKQLSREAGYHLRSTEILYAFALHKARQSKDNANLHFFNNIYPSLVEARQNVALFQHHDAITGTSKAHVMHDYGLKLFQGLQNCRKIEKSIFQYLMSGGKEDLRALKITEDFERTFFNAPNTPVALELRQVDNLVMVFNPLAQEQEEVISIFLETVDFCIYDPKGEKLDYQINPTWNSSGFFRLDTSFVEVVFTANLAPLSITKFRVSRCKVNRKDEEKTEIICMKCPKNFHPNSPFTLNPMPDGAVQLENSEMMLNFDQDTNWLSTITNKRTGVTKDVNLEFAAYQTSQFRNGAYLFKTDERSDTNIKIFDENDLKEVVVVSGPVFSELTVVYESGTSPSEPGSFIHTVRLYHTKDGIQNKGIYIENDFNFGASENHNDIDLFMRFKTNLKNGDPVPEFFTDSNGFQMQKRILVPQINIEGNMYPMTSLAYLEDDSARLSLAVDHAQGAAAWKEGWMEVIVDRRSTFDDSRGLGEGVLDNWGTTHKYWLVFEPKKKTNKVKQDKEAREVSLPSQLVQRLSRRLNNPSIQYISKNEEKFDVGEFKILEKSLPCDTHLFNLRSLSNDASQEKGSNKLLLTLHEQTSDCDLNFVSKCTGDSFHLSNLKIKSISKSSLTGNTVKGTLRHMDDLNIKPMEMESVILHMV